MIGSKVVFGSANGVVWTIGFEENASNNSNLWILGHRCIKL